MLIQKAAKSLSGRWRKMASYETSSLKPIGRTGARSGSRTMSERSETKAEELSTTKEQPRTSQLVNWRNKHYVRVKNAIANYSKTPKTASTSTTCAAHIHL